ncbi:hypothetical protein D6825_03325 [Candidatus Woesearchaeota archaeon]|nr:MAG: hypothetical protein D6825_03325 [Candidatus Woesearchaeota archaeon]
MKLSTKVLLALIVLSAGFFYLKGGGVSGAAIAEHSAFAQCVTDSGAKMYGAYWCPHCNEQKRMFGASWDIINYVECSLPNRAGQTEACKIAGIQSYPTWEFGDGERVSGTQTLAQLSEKTGCSLG